MDHPHEDVHEAIGEPVWDAMYDILAVGVGELW